MVNRALTNGKYYVRALSFYRSDCRERRLAFTDDISRNIPAQRGTGHYQSAIFHTEGHTIRAKSRACHKGEKQPVAEKMRAALPALHRWAFKRFYLDEVYQFVTHRIIFAHISKPIAWFDRHVVDGFFDFLAWGTNALSVQIKGLQSGSIQKYAYVFLLGVLILLLIVLI